MGVLEDIGNSIVNALTFTLTRFTAFLYLLLAVGLTVGWYLTSHAPHIVPLAILLVLALAVLAYMSPAFAVISSVLLFVLVFVL